MAARTTAELGKRPLQPLPGAFDLNLILSRRPFEPVASSRASSCASVFLLCRSCFASAEMLRRGEATKCDLTTGTRFAKLDDQVWNAFAISSVSPGLV